MNWQDSGGVRESCFGFGLAIHTPGYLSMLQCWYSCILWYPEIPKSMVTSNELIIELSAALVNWQDSGGFRENCCGFGLAICTPENLSVPHFWYRCILWYPEIHKLMVTSRKLIIDLGAALVNWHRKLIMELGVALVNWQDSAGFR